MNVSINKIYDHIHYKLGYCLKNILNNKGHPNIIINGVTGSGKTTLVNTVFKHVFGETKTITYDKMKFLENTNYYIFNLINITNKYDFIKLIKEITSKYDHYNKIHKYIIIDNFDSISRNIQNSIKVIIEKSYMNARFIFITRKVGNIEKSLLGNCFILNIPMPSIYDKLLYTKNILKNKKIKFNEYLLLEDCKKLKLNTIINKYLLDCDYKDIYRDFSYRIIDFLLSEINIKVLREIIIHIKSININLNDLFNKLIEIFSSILDNIKMIIVIKEIAKYNYIINKSYRDIISLESLFIRLYKIIDHERLL